MGDEIRQKGEVNTWYVGPYEVLEQVLKVAYELRLRSELSSVHQVLYSHPSITPRGNWRPFPQRERTLDSFHHYIS